ncbi:MAG TPA: CAP domain-containing protein [Actinomycetota bacterium]|nr:CAP domain-containing protein [Actinomycetota bacterium]
MRILRNVLIAAVIALLATPSAPTAARAADNRCWEPRRGELAFTGLINGARGANGQGKLSLDPELSRAARVHSREMVEANTLYHTPDRALRTRVTNWAILGENVGVGSTVASLHEAFMKSTLHRANVLHAGFRHVGIGTLRKDGRLWVTIIFEGVTDPGTPLWMPSC